jgi:hypothetical protein
MNNSSQCTAPDLLEKIIEFTNMTPDPEEWSFERQKSNEPRFVRLEQIQALMNAFIPELIYSKGIRESIEAFYSGDFMRSRQIKDYRKLLETIDKTIAKSDFRTDRKQKIYVSDLRNNYCSLLNYYLKLNSLINHNKSMMEISYPYFFPYILTNSISDSLSSKARKLKPILALFIDPFKRKYTVDELIKQFDFPDVDLIDLDLDWM